MTDAVAVEPAVDAELYAEISQFLFREARLLDEYRFDEWLEVLDEQLVYEMPLTVTRERSEQARARDHEMEYFADNYGSLKTRVARLKTEYAWAEDPPTRTRHLLSNLELSWTDHPDEVRAQYVFVVYANRGSRPDWETFVGDREDRLRRVDGNWRVVRRTIRLDQALLGANSVSIFL